MQKVFLALCVLISAGTLSACSHAGTSRAPTFVSEDRPDVLYNEGLANLQARRFYEAGKKFLAIEARFSTSAYVEKALVMATFCHYMQQHYTDSEATAKRYLDLYPKGRDAPYVAYMAGLSCFHQMSDVPTDQAMASQTIASMERVIKDYPGCAYTADAKLKIRIAREHLAAKEVQIARYYQNTEHYLAAIKRYRHVMEQYYDTNQIEEVLYRLVEVNYALGLTLEARTAAWTLGVNYPNSVWYAYAYALLRKAGDTPNANSNSWMSSALAGSYKKAS